MLLQEIDEIKVDVEYDVVFTDLNRKSLIELMKRYQEFYINNPNEYVMDFNSFLNFYGNLDLAKDLHPDEDEIMQVSANIIDIFEDILDDLDISLPSDDRPESDEFDDVIPARIYGDTYYELEDAFRNIIRNLLNGEEDES